MHHFDINGWLAGEGVIALAVGILLWRYRWLHRAAMVIFFFAAALLTVGITPWFDALARLTTSGAGSVGLLVAALATGAGTAYELRIRRRHARVHSHVTAALFAVSIVMVAGSAGRLLSEAAQSPARTGTALAQSVGSIRSGAAAHAESSHSAVVIAVVVAALVVLLLVAGRRHERRPMPGSSGPKALPSGRPGIPLDKR